MRGDDKKENQNRVVVSFPAEDKDISLMLIKNPAWKTINNKLI